MPIVKKNPKNIANCSCPKCPTYNDCAKTKKELLFCAKETGKAKCEYKMNGCICSNCPVHKQNKLSSGYYCIYGQAQ